MGFELDPCEIESVQTLESARKIVMEEYAEYFPDYIPAPSRQSIALTNPRMHQFLQKNPGLSLVWVKFFMDKRSGKAVGEYLATITCKW